MGWIEYGVVDDFGDDWEDGWVIFRGKTRDECMEWAEDNNFHSASIVRINTMLGEREKVN